MPAGDNALEVNPARAVSVFDLTVKALSEYARNDVFVNSGLHQGFINDHVFLSRYRKRTSDNKAERRCIGAAALGDLGWLAQLSVELIAAVREGQEQTC